MLLFEPMCEECTLAGCQTLTKASLSLPSSAGQERENVRVFVSGDKDRERSLTKYYHWQNRL